MAINVHSPGDGVAEPVQERIYRALLAEGFGGAVSHKIAAAAVRKLEKDIWDSSDDEPMGVTDPNWSPRPNF